MYEAIKTELGRIEGMGGALNAVRNGHYADALARGAYAQQVALERGERVVVGVNRYRQDETVSHPRFRMDETAEQRQIGRLTQARRSRNEHNVDDAL